MDADKLLGIYLSFWDETVGVFEPAKILRLVGRTFPAAEIDWTDRQRDRLLHELESWAQRIPEPERRERFIRNSWGTYQTNGPTYRFIVPLPSGLRVNGGVGRFHVWFRVPADIPSADFQWLESFLKSLRMGDLTLSGDGPGVVTGPEAAGESADV